MAVTSDFITATEINKLLSSNYDQISKADLLDVDKIKKKYIDQKITKRAAEDQVQEDPFDLAVKRAAAAMKG